MKRRIFLRRAGLLSAWLGVTVFLQGCTSSDDDGNPLDPGAGTTDVAGVIGVNHGHSVVITKVQIEAGNAVTLTLSGGGHTHAVTLNIQQVADIGAGAKVQTTSTNVAGHIHGVTFN